MTFDMLDYEGFVAGETKIVHTMIANRDVNGLGRLKVLILVAHWYGKMRNWQLIKELYESIMEDMEMGDKEWTDDFSGYETMLPSMTNIAGEQEGGG